MIKQTIVTSDKGETNIIMIIHNLCIKCRQLKQTLFFKEYRMKERIQLIDMVNVSVIVSAADTHQKSAK